jgi:hypothetical protein
LGGRFVPRYMGRGMITMIGVSDSVCGVVFASDLLRAVEAS